MKILPILLTMLLSVGSTAAMAVELPKIMYDVQEAKVLISEQEISDLHIITVPEASFIKVHFKNFNIPKGVVVRVRNLEGTEVYNYSKHSKAPHTKHGKDDGVKSFAAMSISGDTAIVEVIGYNPKGRKGLDKLDIDYYSAGLPDDEISQLYDDYGIQTSESPESTCGDLDDKKPTPCIIDEYPHEYERMRPVARITNGGGSYCTAWRVGPDNRLFTNNHCNSTQAEIAASEIWFNYEYTSCGGGVGAGTTVPVKVSGKDLLVANHALDMALFTVNDFAMIAQFGYFGLESREPVLGEHIFRGGHGSARRKLATIESDMNLDGFCQVDDYRSGYGENTDIGYWCDSIGGSSGSPVLLRANGRAIALHHFGGCKNAGVKMSRIWPLVSEFFGGVLPDGDDDPGVGRIAPIVDAQFDCTFGVCNFDSSGSTDEDGEVVYHKWDFGDGEVIEASSGTKTYDTTGVYSVKVRVKDNDNNSGYDGFMSPVTLEGENIVPITAFSVTDDNNYTGYFTSESFDWDGELVETCWRVRDSGLLNFTDWVCGADMLTFEHKFQIGGQQVGYIKVTDDFGHTKSYGKYITINGPVMNERPVSGVTVTPVDGGSTFDFASTGYDPDGEIVKWNWMFGDGGRSEAQHPGVYTYTLPDGVSEKTFYVRAYVYDNHGAYGFKGVYVTATVPPPNEPPVADFDYTADLTEVTFTDKSTDDRNDIVAWAWNFGDGATSTVKNPTHLYSSVAATYSVSLKVTDGEGLNDTYTSSVTVDPVPVSVITLSYTAQKARKGKHNLRFNWSGAPTTNVTIKRDGRSLGTFSNDGNETFVVKRNEKGHTYQVCEVNTTSRPNACSNVVRITF